MASGSTFPRQESVPWEIPLTPIQLAYVRGADPDLPLGGVDCIAYLEFHDGSLDVRALPEAAPALLRHPALRCSVAEGVLRELDPEPVPTVKVEDLTTFSLEVADQRLNTIRTEMRGFRPDLSAGRTWLLRGTLLPGGHQVVHLAVSLVVADLAAIGVMMDDLAIALTNREPLPRVETPDLLNRLHGTHRSGGRIPERLAAGREQALLPAPDLPQHPEVMVLPTGRRLTRTFTSEQWHRLAERAHDLRVPLPALCLAVYEETLRRWSQNERFIVTVTGLEVRDTAGDVADRTVSQLHRCRPGTTTPKLLRDIADEYRYRLRKGVPATDEMQESLRGRENHGPWPYVFTFGAGSKLFSDLTVEVLGSPEQAWSITPQVAIDCQMVQFDDRGVTISFDVRAGTVPDDVAEALFESCCDGIRRLAEDCEVTDDFPLSGLDEKTMAARAEVNDTAPVAGGLLHDAFRKRATASPESVAVIWEPGDVSMGPWRHRTPGRLTAAELDLAARRVAARLTRCTAPGDVVLLRLPKGPDQVVAVLGTLYAGCTYLPCGIAQPENRLETVAHDSGAKVRITSDWLEAVKDDVIPEPRAIPAEQLAYIIYTSGSTGRPKGVAIPHHAATNTIIDVNLRNGVGTNDRTLAVSALDFDLSVYDIFGPLSAGGAVVTLGEAQRRDAFAWLDLVKRHGVTLWNTVPSLAEMLCIAASGDAPDHNTYGPRVFMCSGDWMRTDLIRQLHRVFPGTRVVVMGGATEAAIWSNEFVADEKNLLPEWSTAPYGLPLAGQRYRVADAAGRDCPDHVPGELWIGGAGLAAGYFNNPSLTEERFIKVDGERWYRTGDRGAWAPGPLIMFLGRIDSQVKILGHRIECAEVEHALMALPCVEEAAVVDIRNRRALGAAVTGAHPLDTDALRADLANHLPGYMIPSTFRQFDALPRTSNAKTDRNRVREMLESDESPSSEEGTDSSLSAELWCTTLGVDAARDDDNLFELGGDSLAATLLCQNARRAGFEVSVPALFADPTFRGFAAACTHPRTSTSQEPRKETDSPSPAGVFPLTPLQRAYAMGADGLRGVVRAAPVFGARLATLDGSPIHVQSMRQAASDMVARHEVLRLRRESETWQRVVGQGTVAEQNVSTGDFDTQLTTCSGAWDEEPSLTLLWCAALPSQVGVRLPYLGLDARSMTGLIAELARRYAAAVTGEDPLGEMLNPSMVPFRRHAEARLNDEASAHEVVTLPPPPELPLKLPDLSAHTIALTADLTDAAPAIRRTAAEAKVSISALVLSRLARVVAKWCGQEIIGITVPLFQSPDDTGTETAPGNFTRLGLCTLDQNCTATEAAVQLEKAVSGSLPDELDIARAGRAAYPVVFTSTTGLRVGEQLSGTGLDVVETRTSTPGVAIDCQFEWRNDRLLLRWDCPEGLEPASDIRSAFNRFAESLGAVPTPPVGSEEAVRDMDEWAVTIMRRTIALLDTSPLTPVPQLVPVVAAWHEVINARPAPPPGSSVPEETIRLLADCITGRSHVARIAQSPVLSPSSLMLKTAAGSRFLNLLKERLTSGNPIHVVEIGSGDGSLRRAVFDRLGTGTAVSWESVEPDLLLSDVAASRGEPPPGVVPSDLPADLVVCLGGLHRDPRCLLMLADVVSAPGVELWVGEPAAPTPLSLMAAALLDPRVVTTDQCPLHDPGYWWSRLRETGWGIREVTELAPDTFLMKARRISDPDPEPAPDQLTTVSTAPAISPAPASRRPSPGPTPGTGLQSVLAEAWRTHLGGFPRPESDFFTDGGDSLLATRMVTDLRSRGIDIRLVDVFNALNFADLCRVLADREPLTSAGTTLRAVTSGTPAGTPLTSVQQAYVRGRGTDQILGGVAAHCYFEFTPENLDVEALNRAVTNVRDRHEELRKVVVESSMVELPNSPQLLFRSTDPRGETETEVPDVSTAPGLVVRYGPGPEGKDIIAVGMDNLHLDGASMFRVLGELGSSYSGEPLPAPSTDGAAARYLATRPWLLGRGVEELPADAPNRARMETSEQWWRERLDTLPPAPRLASLKEMAAIGKPVFDRVQRDVSAEDWNRVRRVAADNHVTPAALILAAFGEVVAADLAQPELSLNLTRFDRDSNDETVRNCVGDFTSLLPVAVAASGDLMATAHRTNATLLEALEHSEISMAWLSRELLALTGSPERALFPVVFTSGLGLGGDEISRGIRHLGKLTRARSQTPQTLVDLQCHDSDGALHLSADHVTQLVQGERVAAWLDGIVSSLLGLASTTSTSASAHEQVISEIWSGCLGGTRVDATTNFFRAGGDSIAATRCIQEIRSRCGIDAELRTLYLEPDFSSFVQALSSCTDEAQPIQSMEEGTI
jgi:amino acid adenylation domain